MARTVIPHYLEGSAAESGDTKDELLLCLVQAVEEQTQEQTQLMKRIAVALEEISHNYDQRGAA